MIRLNVFIEINGTEKSVGNIYGNDYRDAVFTYEESYHINYPNRPISLNLPFEKEPFSAEETRLFFEGLLPEGFTRSSVADHLHVDAADYLSILSELGRDCLGAIRIIPGESTVVSPGYTRLDAHIKNFSMVYDKDLKIIRLAPPLRCDQYNYLRREHSGYVNFYR